MTRSLIALHPVFRQRVEALLVDPEAKAHGVYVVSAFRSNEYQAQLFRAAVKKYGSEAAARKWVAPPGKSNHGPRVAGYGIAVDFGMRGVKAVNGQWPREKEVVMLRLGARYHLRTPMEWEDWHYEPIEGAAIRLDSWVPTPTAQHQEDDMTPDERQKLIDTDNRVYNLERWVRLLAKKQGITDEELMKAAPAR